MSENILRMAEYEEGPTDCTVFYFPEGAQAAIDLQGIVPATITASHGGCLLYPIYEHSRGSIKIYFFDKFNYFSIGTIN
ncbi:hypothetical protein EDC32_1011363 [Laceyella sacchari]|nr:hypothetical protein EDC32_1011363 [Laceyella sacchari]